MAGSGRRRVLGDWGESYYHVVSRVVDRRFVFGEEEKRVFHGMMRRMARFSGIRCLTYCIMGNHFHLLLAVSDREAQAFRADADDGAVLERLAHLYSGARLERLRHRFGELRSGGMDRDADELREAFLRRMYDLSVFVKELKWRFSRWFNVTSGRQGTLWEGRFRSVLVEGREGTSAGDAEALRAVAAYIDMNPVRAGIAVKPDAYRWCGFGEAVRGGREARAGLASIVEGGLPSDEAWGEVRREYGAMLGYGSLSPGTPRPHDGRVAERFRCRVRGLIDGVAIGSTVFVERVFAGYRHLFGPRRHTGARRIRAPGWDDLSVLRDLRPGAAEPQRNG